MSYARRFTMKSDNGLGTKCARVSRVTAGWARGLWFDLKLSLKLAVEAVGRAVLKPRAITILDLRSDSDRLRPGRMAIAPRVQGNPRPGRAGNIPPTPLP
jgi:hypothetical protein